MAAALISGMLGEYADALTVIAIIIINAILGFVQEYRAEKSLEALKKLTSPEARVLRNGEQVAISAEELVPGDILFIETGDRIPADVRILDAINLEVDEAILTGESHPVKKSAEIITADKVGLGDQKNIMFLGTAVTRGRAEAIVIATGMSTEMGKIAGMMQEVGEEQTPLQKRLEHLGKILVAFCLAICAVVVLTGIWRGEEIYQMFLTGVSLAVAAIPEGLPAIVTVALAIGVQKMIRRNAIVRKLPAVETLGCATYICSDKTGTLTQNEMTVRQILCDGKIYSVTGEGYEPKGEIKLREKTVEHKQNMAMNLLLKTCAICSNTELQVEKNSGLFKKKESRKDWSIVGDPTEGALVVLAAKAGIWRNKINQTGKRILEIPFDSVRKRMSVLFEEGKDKQVLYTKGAPDVVLNLCSHVLINGREVPLNQELKEEILLQNEKMGGQALRVLGMAYRNLTGVTSLAEEELEENLIFLGLAGMIDPPRQSAIKAIQVCRQAGIKVVMITGDHQITAKAVAQELGLLTGDGGLVVTGTEMDNLGDDEFGAIVKDIKVYARVSPSHKLRIVKALKDKGEIVAMTGDGVNDAPAVKEADIGVAMGKTGTDVTKEASAMILADDNFATIVAAVEEGRGIYDNIRKFIRYLLSCNVGEVLTMFFAALLALPLPLLPIQILWVNLVTDGLPAMALGVDNIDRDIMLRKPRHPKESIFSQGLWRKIINRGLQIGLGTLVVFVLANYLSDGNITLARTMAFATLVFSQLFHVFDCKSERHSVFEIGIFSNIYLVLAVACSIFMQLAVIYFPLRTSLIPDSEPVP
jgi:Ca2+-transporting ATPase